MAIRYAVASGNWSNTATWDGGTLPAAGDDVRSNGFTVTVDGSFTCLTISNRAETSPTVAAGGTFSLTNGASVTATDATNGFPLSGTSGHVTFLFSLPAGQSATLIGTHVHEAPAHVNARLCNVTGAGSLHVIGNMTGFDSGATAGRSIHVSAASATVNVTGNGVGGTSNGGVSGIVEVQAANCTVNWVGNISAAGTSATTTVGGVIAIGNVSGTQISVTGNVQGGSRSPAIAGNSPTTNTTITVIGQVIAGDTYPAIGINNVSNNMLIASGPFVSHALSGTVPFIIHRVRWIDSPSGTYFSIATNDLLALRSLYTADYTSALHMPAIADVRSGTVYGPSDELTGTCAVPPAGSVALGVPVDATTGTAAITQQAIADAVGPLIAAYGA
jgi:hypothetical protein